MNKVIIACIIFLLLGAIGATAASNETNKTAPKYPPKVFDSKEDDVRANEPKANASNLTGVQNAITRVSNNETRTHLQEVLAKIDANQAAQLAKLTELKAEIDNKTNETKVEGIGKAKFLGFIPVAKKYAYGIDNNGNIEKKAKFFDFLFKKEDPLQN